MPVVEKTSGGSVYIRPLDQDFSIGDQVDVDDEMAAYLTEERGDFEVIEDDDSAPQEEDKPPDEDGDDFSVNGWLENDYQDRADAVLDGGLDDFLDEIEEAESSETVIDAVQERRDELEG